jgi:hypothetical protein
MDIIPFEHTRNSKSRFYCVHLTYWEFAFSTRTDLYNFLAGSLSRYVSSEDELRLIVGKLEEVVASLRRYVVDSNMAEPQYSVPWVGPFRKSVPEFSTHSSRLPLRLHGLPTLKHDPSSLTHKRLYQIFDKALEPYFSGFPKEQYTCK